MTDVYFGPEIDEENYVDPADIEEHFASLDAPVMDQPSPAANEMIAEIIEQSIAEETERFPWRKIVLPGGGLENRYSNSRILDLDYADGNPSILARMAKEASRVIQFPGNTAYLHGIGIFSSATVVNFEVEYNHKYIPCGMYTLAAQPSGSGKSSSHGFFLNPIEDALIKRNISLLMMHKNIDAEIDELDKKGSKAKTDFNILRTLGKEVEALKSKKLRQPLVSPPKKNVTPQSAEEVAVLQGGVMNVCSDEKEALDTYLGLAYGDGKSSPDNGMFIAAFGGDMMGTARISREGITIPVRGAFAVIAQNSSVDTMILAGAAGRGVSERCLMLKEQSLIGHRVFTRENNRFDPYLLLEYQRLCDNVLTGEHPLRLTMSEACREMIVDLKNDIEPQCRAGNKYGDEQIKGFASKIEQHIAKLAANFHIAEQWNPAVTKKPSFEIQAHNLTKAILVCMDMLDSYKSLIESASDMSSSNVIKKIIIHMKNYALKGIKSFSVDKLRMVVTKEPWYNAIEGKKIDYLLNLLSRCESMNCCHLKEIGKDKKQWQVMINPELRDFPISKEE